MRFTLRSFALFLIFCFVTHEGQAQSVRKDITSAGTEFWLGFMPNFDLQAKQIFLYVTTATKNTIKVETYGDGGVIVSTQTASLTAGSSHQFPMHIGRSETRDREKPVYRAIRVTSDEPCTVYGYSQNTASSDGFLAIPLPGLGHEYYCFSYPDDLFLSVPGSHLGGEFLIVAPYDSTEVTIKTTAHTSFNDEGSMSHAPGDEWKVMLKKGQTYLVQTTGWEFASDDLTGSKITSTKPIAFLTGHQNATVGNVGDTSKNHLIEMLPPTEHWGTQYIDIPPQNRTSGNYYKILSAEDSNVLFDGVHSIVLNAGEYSDSWSPASPSHIQSSNGKRFMAMQYGRSYGYNGDTSIGEPFINTLQPVSGFVTNAIFTRPSGEFQHTVTFISPSDALYTIQLGKSSVQMYPLSSYPGVVKIQIPGMPFAAAQFDLPDSIKTWHVSSSTPFGIYLHGSTKKLSYGYPAAYRYRISTNDSTPPTLTLTEKDCGMYEVIAENDPGVAYLGVAHSASTTPLHSSSVNYDFQFATEPIIQDQLWKGSLRVIDPSKSAQAVLYALGKNGVMTYQLITYEPEQFTATLEWTDAVIGLGDTICQSATIRNTSTDTVVFQPSTFRTQSAFRLSSLSWITLPPGDSTTIDVCFIANDTILHTDSLIIAGLCSDVRLGLAARGAYAIISAQDLDLGQVLLGTTVCKIVRISNTGPIDITVIGSDLDSPHFRLGAGVVFPFVLAPGQSVDIEICFEATVEGNYMVNVQWMTDDQTVQGKRQSQITVQTAVLGVSELEVQSLSVHPNPASTTISIHLPVQESIERVYAIDILGRMHPLTFTQSLDMIESTVAGLDEGTYTLRLETSQSSYTSKLVINR